MARLALLSAFVLMSCSTTASTDSFPQLAEEFVFTTLGFSPVNATAQGLHEHKGARFDEMLDDWSPTAVDRQRQWYLDFRKRLAALDARTLGAEERADRDLIEQQIALALLEFDVIRNYKHNPTMYVELVGNALFTPFTMEYAPKDRRLRHVIARLKRLPVLFDQAQKQLVDAPDIWINVALDENAGNIALIDETLRAAMPEELKAEYDAAAAPALDALRGFERYLRKDLGDRQEGEWRLGAEAYAAKFKLVFGADRTPDQVLAEAEADVQRVKARMQAIAGKQTIAQALGRVAQKHATRESYMADAKRDLEEARAFVRSKNLLALPARDNLQVIDTPEFMRGIYAVGGFNPAPALEPKLGAFYWLTPIPADWPAARVESKLREYNFFKLKLLTIHEAVPGHYVQFEYANAIEPRWRRVLRGVYGNGPYIEGWGQYATEAMLDAGYLDGSADLRLTFLKEELRVLANAIIDIRLQSKGMTDQQALDFMMKETFQEREEATAKLQRAKLSSCQLPMYLAGWRGWRRVRDRYMVEHAGATVAQFHEAALKEGALPLGVLGDLLAARKSQGETPSK